MSDENLEECWTVHWDQTLGWFWLHLHHQCFAIRQLYPYLFCYKVKSHKLIIKTLLYKKHATIRGLYKNYQLAIFISPPQQLLLNINLNSKFSLKELTVM